MTKFPMKLLNERLARKTAEWMIKNGALVAYVRYVGGEVLIWKPINN